MRLPPIMLLRSLLKKLMGSGIDRQSASNGYFGETALNYERSRQVGGKWLFEQECLASYLKDIGTDVATVIDAPVGTGRFFDSYLRTKSVTTIYGFDLSSDMLGLARARTSDRRIELCQHDVVRCPLPEMADLIVSFRFLNLLPPAAVWQAMANILMASRKYALISCRLINPHYKGSTHIENKIYLHLESEWQTVIARHGFIELGRRSFIDDRPGEYRVFLLRRTPDALMPAPPTLQQQSKETTIQISHPINDET